MKCGDICNMHHRFMGDGRPYIHTEIQRTLNDIIMHTRKHGRREPRRASGLTTENICE